MGGRQKKTFLSRIKTTSKGYSIKKWGWRRGFRFRKHGISLLKNRLFSTFQISIEMMNVGIPTFSKNPLPIFQWNSTYALMRHFITCIYSNADWPQKIIKPNVEKTSFKITIVQVLFKLCYSVCSKILSLSFDFFLIFFWPPVLEKHFEKKICFFISKCVFLTKWENTFPI